MTYTFEQIAEYLDDIVDDIPTKYLTGLQGIYLCPDTVHNDKIPSEQYYVMGRYIIEPPLQPRIEIYYGSIMQLYQYVDEQHMKTSLQNVVQHELQHHVETRAGDESLVLEDEDFVAHANACIAQNQSNNHKGETT